MIHTQVKYKNGSSHPAQQLALDKTFSFAYSKHI